MFHPAVFHHLFNTVTHIPYAPWNFIYPMLVAMLVGTSEELFMRGYLLEYLNSKSCRFGQLSSSLIVGILFGTFHIAHDLENVITHQAPVKDEWITFIFQFIYWFTSCLIYFWTSNILYVIILHALIDSPLGAISFYPYTTSIFIFIVFALVASALHVLFTSRRQRVMAGIP